MRAVTRGMRWLLATAGVLVALAGLQLFVFSERTDRYFAWTIDPPLTAAFLGGSYWASVAFEWSAVRRRLWAETRIAVPTVFVFTVATLVVTLVHIENFPLGSEFETGTRVVTWAWIAVYSIVPVLMTIVVAAQWRRRGVDPPRAARLPGWLRLAVGAQGVVLTVVGAALLAAPEEAAGLWPWPLTALTGRAIGAWLVSMAVAAFHALWEDDALRLRPAAAAYVALGVFQGIALARYPDDMGWTGAPGVAYVAFLVLTVLIGASAIALARRADRSF